VTTLADPSQPERTPVVDFDPFRASSRLKSNAAWADLRARCPVAWSEHNGGAWLVASYDANAEAFRNSDVFRSGRHVKSTPGGPGGSAEYSSVSAVPLVAPQILIPQELDPPEWHAYRRILALLLSPRAVERMAPRVREHVSTAIDQFIEAGRCDFVEDLTSPVPGAVVLEWLGLPAADWHRISHALHRMIGTPQESPLFAEAWAEMKWVHRRSRDEVADRRRHPRDDVISIMANYEVDGELISLEYAEGLVALAIAGGVDTTTSVASAALIHLAEHDDDRRALIERPELVDSAIEEFLRVYPAARTFGRTVVEDVELGGCLLRKDDRVILSNVSACHDEAAFPDADLFLRDRSPNRHVAFGLGPHRCPGSHLARLELHEMISQVLERLPDYRINPDEVVEYPNWGAIGGYVSVPATFTPGPRSRT
jgi:cytochrome P450